MLWGILIGTVLLVAFGLYKTMDRERRGIPDVWRQSTEERGLRFGWNPLGVEGEIDGLEVELREFRGHVRLQVLGAPPGLELAPVGASLQRVRQAAVIGTIVGPLDALSQTVVQVPDALRGPGEDRLSQPRITTGDPDFDARVEVRGDQAAALAVFGAEARRVVAKVLVRRSAILDHGRLLAIADLIDRPREGLEILDDLVRAVTAMRAEQGTLVARLTARLASREPPGVRRKALELLQHEAPAEATAAARGLLDDPDPAVRALAAAMAADVAVLTALIRDPTAPGEARALAVRDLPRMPDDALRTLLLELLGSDLAPPAAVVEAVANQAGKAGITGLDDDLVRLLGHPDPAVVLAAAIALGRVGTAAVVPALYAHVAARPARHERAVLDAIAAIQVRVQGVVPGALVLAEEGTGGLVVVDPPDGAE